MALSIHQDYNYYSAITAVEQVPRNGRNSTSSMASEHGRRRERLERKTFIIHHHRHHYYHYHHHKTEEAHQQNQDGKRRGALMQARPGVRMEVQPRGWQGIDTVETDPCQQHPPQQQQQQQSTEPMNVPACTSCSLDVHMRASAPSNHVLQCTLPLLTLFMLMLLLLKETKKNCSALRAPQPLWTSCKRDCQGLPLSLLINSIVGVIIAQCGTADGTLDAGLTDEQPPGARCR